MNFLIKLIKSNGRILLISFIVWFFVLISWDYLEKHYHIFTIVFGKLSQEFILTTVLGILTTVATGLYNYQKNKIKENKEILKQNNEMAIAAIRRLEDMIDGQTFELRKIEDFSTAIGEIRGIITNLGIDHNKALREIDKELKIIQKELERQKEQLIQNDRVLSLTTFIQKDLQEREILKMKLKQVLLKLEEDKKK